MGPLRMGAKDCCAAHAAGSLRTADAGAPGITNRGRRALKLRRAGVANVLSTADTTATMPAGSSNPTADGFGAVVE